MNGTYTSHVATCVLGAIRAGALMENTKYDSSNKIMIIDNSGHMNWCFAVEVLALTEKQVAANLPRLVGPTFGTCLPHLCCLKQKRKKGNQRKM